MTSINRPDKITLDAYSDPNLEVNGPNGSYNRFTNQLRTPILNAKGIQLLNANFINSILQLNDNSQLFFFYYASATQAGIATLANLKCVRLHPSTFIPRSGYTAFTRNRYFNSVTELVAALNAAASTGGDDVTFNPLWVANQVTFSYDTTTRKVSVQCASGTYIAPAAADDPNVLNQLRGTTNANNRIRMSAFNSPSALYSAATLQPYVEGVSMNARLGYAMAYASRGLWWSSASQVGVATSTGFPLTNTPIEADSSPILLGSQNCSIYLSIVTGSGMDSTGRKNLIQTIPIEVAPLNINSYTASSVEKPAISIPTEIYEITAELLDDYGQPFVQPGNYNTNIAFSVYY
jgi:hypothetical protein